jgi:polyhydroxybutyrate depolymerase
MARLFAALALLTLAACSSAPPAPSSASIKSDETLDVGGRTRHFLVHNFSGGRRAPVVIILHGGGGDAPSAVSVTRFDVPAARDHFITIYPAGTAATPGSRQLTWNAGHCCAYAMENKVDDVGFIAKMIDGLVASGRADPKRIYVTGMSNGAMLAHVLARELPDRIAAIAPVVGALFGDEPPPRGPVAAVIMVGQEDQTVPATGGPVGGPDGQGLLDRAHPPANHDLAPDVAAADYWAKANGCATPIEAFDPSDKLVELRWSKCTSGKAVRFYRVAHYGHAWPGYRSQDEAAPTPDFDATDVIWRFFRNHPKK